MKLKIIYLFLVVIAFINSVFLYPQYFNEESTFQFDCFSLNNYNPETFSLNEKLNYFKSEKFQIERYGNAVSYLSYDKELIESEGFNNKEPSRFRVGYCKGFLSDIGYTFVSPFRWKKKNWKRFLLISGIGMAIYLNDEKLMYFVQDHKSENTRKIARTIESFGDPLYLVTGGTLLFTYSLIFKDKKVRKFSAQTIKSILISNAVVFTIKFLAHRHRPETDDGYNAWDGPSFSMDNHSFISGHSATAFSLATVSSSFVNNRLFTILAYSTATITALSRVHDRKHWVSDTFLGAVTGYLITRTIIRRDRERRTEKKTVLGKFISRLIINPVLGFNKVGLSLGYDFR